MWPEIKSLRRRHMWVEFVVGSLLCSERFFSRYIGFPLSSKTDISKFQFDQESGRQKNHFVDVLPQNNYLFIIIYLFIYLFINSRPTQPTYRYPNPRRRFSSAFFRLVPYLVDSFSVIFRISDGSIVWIFTRQHCWWWLLRRLYVRWPPRTTGWLSTRFCLEYLMERLYHWSLSLPEMLLAIIGCLQL